MNLLTIDAVQLVLPHLRHCRFSELAYFSGVAGHSSEVLAAFLAADREQCLHVRVLSFHAFQIAETAFGAVDVDLGVGVFVGQLAGTLVCCLERGSAVLTPTVPSWSILDRCQLRHLRGRGKGRCESGGGSRCKGVVYVRYVFQIQRGRRLVSVDAPVGVVHGVDRTGISGL